MPLRRLEELLHRQRKALGLPRAIRGSVFDGGVLTTWELAKPRFVDMIYSQTNAGITVTAPDGYAWQILDAECIYTADANVADRTVVVRKIVAATGGLAIGYFSKTITAGQTRYLAVGPTAPSADAYPNHSYCRVQPWIFGGIALDFRATANGQVGDALSIRGVALEVLSVEP